MFSSFIDETRVFETTGVNSDSTHLEKSLSVRNESFEKEEANS